VQHLYTSTGNEVTLYVSRGRLGERRPAFDIDKYPRLIISYEGTHASLHSDENADMSFSCPVRLFLNLNVHNRYVAVVPTY